MHTLHKVVARVSMCIPSRRDQDSLTQEEQGPFALADNIGVYQPPAAYHDSGLRVLLRLVARRHMVLAHHTLILLANYHPGHLLNLQLHIAAEAPNSPCYLSTTLRPAVAPTLVFIRQCRMILSYTLQVHD